MVVGLSQGLRSLGEVPPFTFFTFPLSFFLRGVLGDGVLPLSTECDRFLRLVRPDLASRLTVHQLLFPELSFCTFTKRLCSERLCLTEFCREGGREGEEGKERARNRKGGRGESH